MVRDAVPLEECRRALVIKLRHPGDVLLASPVLSLLKSRGLEVDALVYDDTAPMLEGHPALSELHTIGRKWRNAGALARIPAERELYKDLKYGAYDLIVHLSEQARGAWLARALGPRYSVAPRMPERGAFWAKSFTHLYPLVPRRHEVEVNLDALRRIGLQPGPQDKKVVFVPGAEAEGRIDALVGGEPFVHVHPVSRWRSRCWPVEKNAELIDRLAAEGIRTVLTAAPDAEEMTLIDRILEKAQSQPINLAGQLGIKELGALAARARLFIGIDSMPMHLAAAMGVPAIALFGPSGETERGPWGTRSSVVSTTHSCRPCGQDGCGGGNVSECLTLLPVDAVFSAAREFLEAAA